MWTYRLCHIIPRGMLLTDAVMRSGQHRMTCLALFPPSADSGECIGRAHHILPSELRPFASLSLGNPFLLAGEQPVFLEAPKEATGLQERTDKSARPEFIIIRRNSFGLTPGETDSLLELVERHRIHDRWVSQLNEVRTQGMDAQDEDPNELPA